MHCERFFTIPSSYENELIIREENKIRYEKVTPADIFKVYFDHICSEIQKENFLGEQNQFLRNAKSLDLLNKI